MSEDSPKDSPHDFTVVPEQGWEVYSVGSSKGPIIISFYTGALELDPKRYPHCARVRISIQNPQDNGLNGPDESERLYALEDQLTAVLKDSQTDCVLLGRLTHNGRRELVFQVADWQAFRPAVGQWLGSVLDYDIDVAEHEGWGFFKDCLWPGREEWAWILDRHLIDKLVSHGSDPEKPHDLDFMFLGARKHLKHIHTILSRKGYRGQLGEHASTLTMTKTMPLDLREIVSHTLIHRALAGEHGVEYDGWGAVIVS